MRFGSLERWVFWGRNGDREEGGMWVLVVIVRDGCEGEAMFVFMGELCKTRLSICSFTYTDYRDVSNFITFFVINYN